MGWLSKATHAVKKIVKHGVNPLNAWKKGVKDITKGLKTGTKSLLGVEDDPDTTTTPYSDNLSPGGAGEKKVDATKASSDIDSPTKKKRTNKSSLKIESNTGVNYG